MKDSQDSSNLTDECDALLARMQTKQARTGMILAFNASPKKLGKAAVAAARKRAEHGVRNEVEGASLSDN